MQRVIRLCPRCSACDVLGSREPLPVTRDADLEMLVHLYRTLPERQRRTLVAVVRATADSLGETTPAAGDFKASHAGS